MDALVKYFSPLCLVLLLVSCGETLPPKVYAQGDAFDPLAFDRLQEDAAADAEAAPRKISIPPNSQEKGGLRIDMSVSSIAANVNPSNQAVEIKAGNPIYVNLTVRNTTVNSVTVPYATEKRFDVVVYNDAEQRNAVFVHSESQMYAQLFQEVVLSAGANVKRVLEVPTMKLDAYAKDAPRGLTRPLTAGDYWFYALHEGTPNLATGPIRVTVLE